MPGPSGQLQSLFEQFVSSHGEEAVQRALQLSPMLFSVRANSAFGLETAAHAARTDGISGALVLGLPRKPSDPTEVTYITGSPELIIRP